jgi:hypothetical protein
MIDSNILTMYKMNKCKKLFTEILNFFGEIQNLHGQIIKEF